MGMKLGGNKRQGQYDEYVAARRQFEDVIYCDCSNNSRREYTTKNSVTGAIMRHKCGNCGKEIDPKELLDK